MSVESEITRMKREGFWFTQRPNFYRRKRDGYRVAVADWPDGDVTWVLEPLPIIAPSGRAVGTCSRKTFDRNHVEEPRTPQ